MRLGVKASVYAVTWLRWSSTAIANVEKIIFNAPKSINIPNFELGLSTLKLHVFTPANNVLRTVLERTFANEKTPRGTTSWYFLSNLSEGQRYELRVCWPAVQPTDFSLSVYPLSEVFDTPSLISELAGYSENKRAIDDVSGLSFADGAVGNVSLLFLKVDAAANYFTTNTSLMSSPPPVDVDLILDPFLLNIFPRSLVPTAIYLLAVAGASWFISGSIWKWFDRGIHAEKSHRS